MPQEIRVLQCFQCCVFQVDIVKTVNKWQCRVCNTKQTVRKECFRGSGTECRLKVQELNMANAQKHNNSINCFIDLFNEVDEIKSDCTYKTDLDEVNNDVEQTNQKTGNETSKLLKVENEPASCNSKFNMFNFSQNKKWTSSSKTAVHKNISYSTNEEKQTLNLSKKSKWDDYV